MIYFGRVSRRIRKLMFILKNRLANFTKHEQQIEQWLLNFLAKVQCYTKNDTKVVYASELFISYFSQIKFFEGSH